MKKILIFVLAVAFAIGLAGGIQVAVADTNTGGGTTNSGGSTNTGGGSTNTGSKTVRYITWGQLKVMYLDEAPNKNTE